MKYLLTVNQEHAQDLKKPLCRRPFPRRPIPKPTADQQTGETGGLRGIGHALGLATTHRPGDRPDIGIVLDLVPVNEAMLRELRSDRQ